MTELERVQQVKMYMDKLANGVNPLNDEPVPEAELINDVHLSRCFFFVSDILRQVIEAGGVKPAGKKTKRLPLNIPFERREQFEYSDKPLAASEIAKRVNALRGDENMKKLTYRDIVNWLMGLGMLEETTVGGKQVKRPTQSGLENGIFVENRTGRNGAYQVVVYNAAAQHFLLDNLDAIIGQESAEA